MGQLLRLCKCKQTFSPRKLPLAPMTRGGALRLDPAEGSATNPRYSIALGSHLMAPNSGPVSNIAFLTGAFSCVRVW